MIALEECRCKQPTCEGFLARTSSVSPVDHLVLCSADWEVSRVVPHRRNGLPKAILELSTRCSLVQTLLYSAKLAPYLVSFLGIQQVH